MASVETTLCRNPLEMYKLVLQVRKPLKTFYYLRRAKAEMKDLTVSVVVNG